MFQKLVTFYQSGMNVNKIEEDSFSPLNPFLKQITAINDFEDLETFIIDTMKYNGSSYSLIRLFMLLPIPDSKNTKEEIIYLVSSGLGLPDRDYYLKDEFQKIKEEYKKYIVNIFLLLNIDPDTANKYSNYILTTETELAKVTYTNVQKGDIELQYNKLTFKELEEKFSRFHWEKLFKSLFNEEIPYLSIDNFNFYTKLIDLLVDPDNIPKWKAYLTFKVISNSAPYLNDKIYQTYFDFYGKILIGQKKPKPRYERIINLLDETVGELMGKLFVLKYFPESSKEKMTTLVDNLREAFEERIINLDWMTEKTKEQALKKFKTFRAKIGYPDVWNSYNNLVISSETSFMTNVLNSRKVKFEIDFKNRYKEPDLNKWEMSTYTINAYFDPWKNEIVFPAGILQFPFFDPNAHDAINYGGIGVVIGHEKTHGYDKEG